MATTEAETYIGKSVPRKEDAKLLTGQSRFIDDMNMTGMVWASLVRSPYAHAKITRVDVSAAREAEGVVAVFSGADLADDWAATLPCVWLVTEDTKQPMHRPLATDKVRYQGDGVAVVIAESRALAKDAAELVEVDYEELPAVIDPEAALADGAPILHDELGTNHCFTWKLEGGDVEGVFGNAPVTVKERYRQQRLIPNAIEPRGVIATYEPSQDEYTLWSATQIPHILRFWLAIVLGVPESRLRVIAPDVGGGFGSKLNVYAEEALALALAKRDRPAREVDRRALGGLPRHDPRPRPVAGDGVRGRRGREDPRRPRQARGRAGRLPPARHAPARPSWAAGSTAGRTTSRPTRWRWSVRSPRRPRPTPTAAPDGPRRRT